MCISQYYHAILYSFFLPDIIYVSYSSVWCIANCCYKKKRTIKIIKILHVRSYSYMEMFRSNALVELTMSYRNKSNPY